jgi:hypothetical protein
VEECLKMTVFSREDTYVSLPPNFVFAKPAPQNFIFNMEVGGLGLAPERALGFKTKMTSEQGATEFVFKLITPLSQQLHLRRRYLHTYIPTYLGARLLFFTKKKNA